MGWDIKINNILKFENVDGWGGPIECVQCSTRIREVRLNGKRDCEVAIIDTVASIISALDLFACAGTKGIPIIVLRHINLYSPNARHNINARFTRFRYVLIVLYLAMTVGQDRILLFTLGIRCLITKLFLFLMTTQMWWIFVIKISIKQNCIKQFLKPINANMVITSLPRCQLV